MTYTNGSGAKPSPRKRARDLLDKMDQADWSVWQNFKTRRGIVGTLCHWLVDTFAFLYLLPLLPGVTLDGSISAAALSAFILLIVRIGAAPLVLALLRESLAATANGWENRAFGIYFTMVIVSIALIPIQFEILTIVPGNVVLHGFLAWLLITVTWIVLSRGFSILFEKAWPQTKSSLAKDT